MSSMPTTLRKDLPKGVIEKLDELAVGEAREPVKELMARHAETGGFTSDAAAYLAGVAMQPSAKKQLDLAIDETVRVQSKLRLSAGGRYGSIRREEVDEVVIGSGVHAAIYCTVRCKMGHPRPVVIEQEDRIGGVFAMTQGPAFFLNSRNRPGPLGIPGDDRSALNVIPGAPVQPSDLSASEYQRNNDLAFAIRMTLLMYSRPIVGQRVTRIAGAASPQRPFSVCLEGDTRYIIASRVIDARGLGVPLLQEFANDQTILTYPQFMRRLDTPFPFKGMRKVAVIGAGDSGKTVVEALVGQGPSDGWSTASTDWIERIDWYNPDIQVTGDEWVACNRSRYRPIARFMPRSSADSSSKINPKPFTAETPTAGYNCAYIGAVPYDCVVICAGWQKTISPLSSLIGASWLESGDRRIGFRHGQGGMYGIGPAVGIPLTPLEDQQYGRVAENGTAIFRLAERTAMVAATT